MGSERDHLSFRSDPKSIDFVNGINFPQTYHFYQHKHDANKHASCTLKKRMIAGAAGAMVLGGIVSAASTLICNVDMMEAVMGAESGIPSMSDWMEAQQTGGSVTLEGAGLAVYGGAAAAGVGAVASATYATYHGVKAAQQAAESASSALSADNKKKMKDGANTAVDGAKGWAGKIDKKLRTQLTIESNSPYSKI